ncbi:MULTISPECIES: delta-lactam-biosynthetic de-N-acetylase [Ureibacillus]|uniref:Peptidoglycan-N-acetylmuramic acid deacetylase n=1 Tax=Ureibacillus thermosphaericus TaxID=51173 RepID=A0A840PQL2_URETH|nr:peptidoglycan-N-acetylmuramic acid deacetylase [Ureibacillus thermosphaericus]NKZ32855.1 polysaccharide deacetylase family protein [Ureibacillus thermosphaericus]
MKWINIALAIVLLFSIPAPQAFAKEYHWGFTKSKNGNPPDVGAEFEGLLKNYGAFYRGNPEKKVIYLTFDNGFEAGYTEKILDTLKKEDVKATFFLTGHYLTSASDLVKRMVKDGHTIGNHSDKHPNMARLSREGMLREWQNFDKKLKEITGINRTYYVRPPEGIFSTELLEVGNENGYTHIFWSIAFRDWDTDQKKGADYAYNELISQLHPGAIILMHTVAEHNADALPDFIKEAKKQGYTFGTLDDLVFDHLVDDYLWGKAS